MKSSNGIPFINTFIRKPVFFAVALSIILTARASGAGLCQGIYRETTHRSEPGFIRELPDDLLAAQLSDAARFSTREIRRLNDATLRELEQYIPEQGTDRAGAVSITEIQPLLEIVKNHAVVAPANKAIYQPENVDIGYCFGRATYLHLLLLKMGVAKPSIVKLWAVGTQENPSGEKNWGFHVATAVYVRGYGWMTIDTNRFKIQPVEHWIQSNTEKSTDGKMRIYVSSAERFGLNVPKYNRLQMGLDLRRDQDWYQGYFSAMLKALREESLESLGVRKVQIVPVARKQAPTGAWEYLRNLFSR